MTFDERKRLVSGLLEISRLPDCPESQTVAIQALENFLLKLKSTKAPAVSTDRNMAYLPCLAELFMCVGRKNYIRACNLVDEFVCLYWEEENTCGLVSILEKIKY